MVLWLKMLSPSEHCEGWASYFDKVGLEFIGRITMEKQHFSLHGPCGNLSVSGKMSGW